MTTEYIEYMYDMTLVVNLLYLEKKVAIREVARCY